MAKNLKFPVDFLASRRLDMILAKIQLNPKLCQCVHEKYIRDGLVIFARSDICANNICANDICAKSCLS